LLTRIHIHNHEINQGQRILELDQYILFYPVGLHRALSLLNPIPDIPLQSNIPVGLLGRGGGSGLEARLGVTVRGVVTTTLRVT
jgi:hypothetical protein